MRRLTVPFLLVFMVLYVSCAETNSTATMKILLHTQSKTMTVNDQVLDITKYSISGKGPGGKTFAVDSTSSSVTLTGMQTGSWVVTASGLNSKGKEIAQGSVSFVLDSSQTTHSISLSSLTGKGSLQLKFEWDQNLAEPKIVLSMYGFNSSSKIFEKNISPVVGSTSSSFTVSDLDSGFYLVNALLYNADEKVCGTTEAVRIVNGEKTAGSVCFKTSSSYSEDLAELNVFRKSQSALTGHLSGIKESLSAGEKTTVSLDLDSSYSSSENFEIIWYYDGSQFSTSGPLSPYSNEISIYPTVGCHILNAVVLNNSDKSYGSVSWKFEAKATGREGLALFISNVEPLDNSALFMSVDSFLLPLPDDKFVIISPQSGTMRLFNVYNNNFSIVEKTASSDVGWSFLSDVTFSYSKWNMTDFAVVDSKYNLNVLHYNRDKLTIEKAFRGENEVRYEGGYPNLGFTFEDISKACSSHGSDFSGSILLYDSTCKALLEIVSSGNGVTAMGCISKPYADALITDFEIKAGRFVCLLENESCFYSCTWDGLTRSSDWTSSTSYMDSPSIIKIINADNILVSDGNTVRLFGCSKSGIWNKRSEAEVKIKTIDVSEDGRFVWIIDTDNMLITYSTSDNQFFRIGYTQLEKEAAGTVLNNNTLLVRNSDASMTICIISEGD